MNTRRNTVAAAFRMEDAPTLTVRALHKSAISVTELKCDRPNFGITDSIPKQDAYLVALQLRACPNHDLYFDGRLTQPRNFKAGVTSIYDLRTEPVADLRDPFHSLMVHLPRTALEAAAQEAGVRAKASPRVGGLACWQEARAKELMAASLHEEISMRRLAEECGLSVRHFARAFRQSTGVPPHRWLLRYRVDRAKELLRNQTLSLADTALACGFADQSHFTRVFTALTGESPGAWRRQNRTGTLRQAG